MRALLNSNRFRYMRGRPFYSALISAVVVAFLSLAAVRLITRFSLTLPAESFAPLYSNGFYHFGILRVESLHDLLNIPIEQLMASAFGGGFLALILAIFIPMFVRGSFRGGFVQNAYIRGKSKISILTSYVISTLEIFLVIFAVYIVSLLVFAPFIVEVTFSVTELLNCLMIFARQLVAHFVFMLVCITVSFSIRKTSSCIIALIFSVIAFPRLLVTVDLIIQREFNLSSLWIVNIIEHWAIRPPENYLFSSLVALGTLLIAIGSMLISFYYNDINH